MYNACGESIFLEVCVVALEDKTFIFEEMPLYQSLKSQWAEM